MEPPGHWNKQLTVNLTPNSGPRIPYKPVGIQPVRPLLPNVFAKPENNVPVEKKPELWVETQTADGKKYFYHAKTRVSSWVLPENIKLMTQHELESLSKHTDQLNEMTFKKEFSVYEKDPLIGGCLTSLQTSLSSYVNEELSSINLPDAVITKSDSTVRDSSMLKSETSVTSQQLTLVSDATLIDSKILINNSDAINYDTKTSSSPIASSKVEDSAVLYDNEKTVEDDVELSNEQLQYDAYANSSIVPLESSNWPSIEPCHWVEHRNEHGRLYYYNIRTMQSTWVKPIPFKIWEDEQKSVLMQEVSKIESQIKKNNQLLETTNNNLEAGVKENNENNLSLEVTSKPIEGTDSTTNTDVIHSKEQKPLLDEEGNKILEAASDKKPNNSVEKKNVKDVYDPTKPINTKPIPGTPWCMVWTGDGRIFFFNPSTNVSVWDRPPELAKRTDVDKMMELTPEILKEMNEEPAIKKAKFETTPHQQSSKNFNSQTHHPRQQFQGQRLTRPGLQSNIREQRPQAPVSVKPIWDKDKGVDAAMEARAAVDRSALSLAERTIIFEQMLEEKQVSCFSSWDRELPKFVFDSRYLILVPKDRKPAFDNYLRKKVEEERKERGIKIKQNKDDFRKLMQSARLHGKSLFSEFSSKFCRDPHFKCIDKAKERENLFNEYIQELRKQEQEESNSNLRQVRDDFMHLLEGCPGIGTNMSWGDAKHILMYSQHAQLIINMPAQTEQWFSEFCKGYIDSSDYDLNEVAKSERERQERMQASMRERERRVAETLHVSFQERDKERKVHQREEAIINFKNILVDLVKDSDAKWRDKRKAIKKDERYSLTKNIDKKEKEHLFNQHVINLEKKSKDLFYRILNDAVGDKLTTSWKDIRKKIRDDPRCTKITAHDKRREKEFDEYIIQRRVKAKQDFKELLTETKIIKHRISLFETDSIQYIKEIVTALQKDKRYDMLNSIADERHQLLLNYIDEVSVQKEPPPTSSEPRKPYSK